MRVRHPTTTPKIRLHLVTHKHADRITSEPIAVAADTPSTSPQASPRPHHIIRAAAFVTTCHVQHTVGGALCSPCTAGVMIYWSCKPRVGRHCNRWPPCLGIVPAGRAFRAWPAERTERGKAGRGGAGRATSKVDNTYSRSVGRY